MGNAFVWALLMPATQSGHTNQTASIASSTASAAAKACPGRISNPENQSRRRCAQEAGRTASPSPARGGCEWIAAAELI